MLFGRSTSNNSDSDSDTSHLRIQYDNEVWKLNIKAHNTYVNFLVTIAQETLVLLFTSDMIDIDYRNDPKFSDRHAWANSADPDQTAPRLLLAVWSGSTLFAIPSPSFGLITLW